MADIRRVPPSSAWQSVRSGTAFLVCAYEDEERCTRNRLEGSLTLQEFQSKAGGLDTKQQIIFYCA